VATDGSAGAVNIFGLDGPTATGNGLLRAAASFTAETTRGLSAGFDLQARFEGAVDAKLTDAVRASFRGSGSASISAEASAYFPVDVFDFGGVTVTLKAQAEARASVKLDVELQAHHLVAAVLEEQSESPWRPYVDAVVGHVSARAGIYASAAVCVKAAAETKAGIRLFPKADEPAGTVFVVNFGYGFIYGYSWGLLAELSIGEPAELVRDVFGVTARQLADAFEAESARRPEPVRGALAEAADLVELAVPALAGLLCTLLADMPEADRQTRLSTSVGTLGRQLGQHLLERLLSAAMDELGELLGRLGLPTGPDIGNALTALLNAVGDTVVAGRDAVSLLPDAIDAVVDALFALVERGMGDTDRELLHDVTIGIWAGVSLLVTEPGTRRPPAAGIRQLLLDEGIDPAAGPVADLPARALGRSATRLLRRAGAATWLSEVTGIALEDLLRLPWQGVAGEPAEVLRTFLASVGSVLSKELLDELPLDDLDVPAEAVESIRTILQVAVEELPGLLDDISTERVLRRLRERVSVGLLTSVGPPLVAFLENVARAGFDQAVPAIRRLETQARDAGDVIPQFPRGAPLERFTSALEDLGRESVDVTIGLPTSELLGHLASKLERWRTQRLPVELELVRDMVCLRGGTSAGLLDALDDSDTAVVLDALLTLAEHHLEQIRSITVFLVEDSADLLARLTTLPFEQAARLFAASVKFSFELTAAMIAELAGVATDVDHRIDELQVAVAGKVAALGQQCGQLADLAANAVAEVIDRIIADLVGNDPVARFAAQLAFNALTGGIAPVVERALRDVSATLRVAGESIAAAAQAGTLGQGGALSLLDGAVRGTASRGVSVPITVLVPIIPPFWFENVTVATVTVPAEWLGRALWGAVTDVAGVGPLITTIDDTARSLQLTSAALETARAAGTSDEIRQRAAALESRVAAAVLDQPITIEFDVGGPQSLTTADRRAVVTGRVTGVDRSYVMPLTLADGPRTTVIPARVRFTCQGVAVPPQSITWTDEAAGTLAFSFAVTTRTGGGGADVVVRPGVCVVTGLAAMGAWNGASDDVGASRSLTLLLVPSAADQGWHVSVDGWSGPDGAVHVAYLAASDQRERVLTLLTRGPDGAWSVEEVTTLAGVGTPATGSGLAGWSDGTGAVHLVQSVADGGLYLLHRAADGAWSTELLDGGDPRRPTRTGRPLRLAGSPGQLAYVDEHGRLRLADLASREGERRVTNLTTTAGLPPATAAGGLASWQTAASGSDDLAAEGNLLMNPRFADGPRSRWELAAFWTGWSQGQDGVMLARSLPSTLPAPESRRMLHVSATIDTAGVVQTFAPQDTGPDRVESAAWVYVLRGEVAIGTGNGGSTGYDARTSERGRWIRLTAPNGVSPANEFIVYASSPGGAEFYVAAASVREPGQDTVAFTTSLVYTGADGHVHRASRAPSASTWQVEDLTAATGALTCRPDTDLATWADDADARHVSFCADDGQLYEFVGPDPGSGWDVRPLVPPGERLPLRDRGDRFAAAATWALDDTRGLAVAGPGGRARIATSVGGTGPWTWTDTPGWAAATRGALAAWTDPAGIASAVIIDRTGGLHLLTGDGGPDWTITDLTRDAPAPRADVARR
jgi:hypothetical protein